MKILLESGRLNDVSLSWMLVRKTDWHDEEGLRLALEIPSGYDDIDELLREYADKQDRIRIT